MSSIELTDASTDLEILLDRVKERIGSKTDADAARALEVSSATIPTWRKRGTVPYGDFVRWAYKNDVSMDWLFYGGPIDIETATDLELGRSYPIDKQLLAICIEAADVMIKEMGVELSPEKRAQIVSLLYEQYEDMAEPEIDSEKVVRLIKLAS